MFEKIVNTLLRKCELLALLLLAFSDCLHHVPAIFFTFMCKGGRCLDEAYISAAAQTVILDRFNSAGDTKKTRSPACFWYKSLRDKKAKTGEGKTQPSREPAYILTP